MDADMDTWKDSLSDLLPPEQRADSEHCCKMKTLFKIELRVKFSRESRKLGTERDLDRTAPLPSFDLSLPAAFWEGCSCGPLCLPVSGQEWEGSSLKPSCWDCPGGPLIKNLCFQCKSIPGQGTKMPHARQYSKKNKTKQNKTPFLFWPHRPEFPSGDSWVWPWLEY